MDSVTIQLTKTSSETPAGTSGTATIQTSSLSNNTLKQIGNTNTSASITPAPSSSLTSITIEIFDEALFDALSIASLIPSLRKDGSGQVIIKVKNNKNSNDGNGGSLMSNIHAGIALAGLTAESESVQNDDMSWRVITSKYKPPQVSASTVTVARINTAKKNTNSVKNAITINIDFEEDDLINEDDLLNDDGMGLVNAPPVMEARPKEDDCGGRKPCDNCTCGRAEAEAERAVDENNPQNEGVGERKIIKDLKSSCGNCSKGDAFRCAGCPFLGKPAFKEGEEHLVLDLTDDL